MRITALFGVTILALGALTGVAITTDLLPNTTATSTPSGYYTERQVVADAPTAVTGTGSLGLLKSGLLVTNTTAPSQTPRLQLPHFDVEVSAQFTISTLPTSGYVEPCVNVRANSAGTNYYEACLRVASHGASKIVIDRRQSSAITTLLTANMSTPYVANTPWTVTLAVNGAQLWVQGSKTSASGTWNSVTDRLPIMSGVGVGVHVWTVGTPVNAALSSVKFSPLAVTINISAYGVAGDNRTDNTTLLNRAFSEAPSGSTIEFDAGKIYRHSGLLLVRVNGLHITGPGVLLATNQHKSALQILANNVTIDGGLTLKFDTKGASRQATGSSTMIYDTAVTGTNLTNLTVDGSPSAGIMFYGASNYTVDHVLVKNTLADSIHSTHGSHAGLIENSTSIDSGDDGFANVSYVSDKDEVYDMTYNNDTVQSQAWGRGFSVVGGHDITFKNIHSDGSSSAAIYIAAEAQFKTYGVAKVHVDGATLDDSNTASNVGHGAVLVYNSQPAYAITDVDMSNVVITNTRAGAPREVGIQSDAGTGVLRIGLYNFTITGSLPSLGLSGRFPRSYDTVGWTVNGVPIANHLDFKRTMPESR